MKEQRRKQFFATVGAGLTFGLLAHLFGMLNMLQSSDSLTAIWGTGAGLTSGRWVLELINEHLCKLWPIWNMGYYNNFLALILLALSAFVITEIFRIDDLWIGAMLGAVMTSFPAVNATFLYTFASVHYAAAIFMIVLGVWLGEKYKFGFIAAAVLTSISMGIYQGYFPVMICLYLAILIVRAFEGKSEGWNLLKRAFLYLGTLILALVLYFAEVKIMLAVTGIELSEYQGISSMGGFSIRELPYRLIVSYKELIELYSNPSNHILGTAVVMLGLNLLSILCLAQLVYIFIKERRKLSLQNKLLLILFVILYPLGLNSIRIMCFYSDIHEVMLYSLVMLYLLPLLVCDKFKNYAESDKEKKAGKIMRWLAVALMSIVCINYSMQSNAVYQKVYFDRVQTQSYWTSVISRAQSTEGYKSDMEWAIVGTPEDDLLNNTWSQVPYTNVGSTGYKISNYYYYIKLQLGYDIKFAEDDTLAQICSTQEFKEMDSYPSDNSISVIDNVLVIKFS